MNNYGVLLDEMGLTQTFTNNFMKCALIPIIIKLLNFNFLITDHKVFSVS
jgi:hypothetical protein